MISDEMRELLSVYVDGELRDSDAARVEDMSKRDPELRREIEAYRILRRQLKAWDEAEHGGEPSPELMRTALARARAYVAHSQRVARARVFHVLFHPLALAAGILLAAGLGFVLAARTAPAVPARSELSLRPVAPYGDHALEGTVLAEHAKPDLSELEDMGRLFDILRLDHRLEKGVPMSDRALDLLEEWRGEELVFERRKQRQALAAKAQPAERRTGTWNSFVMTAVSSYRPVAAPYAGMVLLTHPQRVRSRLPKVGAFPAGAKGVIEPPGDEDHVIIATDKVPGSLERMALLGEVWASGRNGRARIVGATAWIRDAELVPVVWADEIAQPRTLDRLTVHDVVLGPAARQRVLAAKARDEEFRGWLSTRFKNRRLADVFKAKAAAREREVAKLMKLLAADPEVSGFSVVGADDQVMGVELFANHALLMAFAPRLLRGYLLEAGPKGIRLKTRREGATGPAVQTTSYLLHTLPEQARFEEVKTGSTEQWPEGLQRVNLMSPTREIRGHGLLHQGRPVHLTIFGG